MRGPKPTLQEIVLDLCPYNEIQPVDLVCYEQLGESEDEIDEPDHAVNHQHQLLARREEPQRHTIQCSCCKCNNTLQLVVEASRDTLRQLQQLFMDSLGFVCPWCATANQ
uniref:Protein E7 n=1 Tax=Human papillomavirus 39 TaxID=10588 RepID=T2A565_HPV39|nr:E7 [human papillomavirus 39]WAB53350.1 E7 [human papillomavirus 39]